MFKESYDPNIIIRLYETATYFTKQLKAETLQVLIETYEQLLPCTTLCE